MSCAKLWANSPHIPEGGWHGAMEPALQAAFCAQEHGDIPIGAAIFSRDGGLLAVGENRREIDHDPLAHAEIVALRAAAQVLGSWRMDDCTLVVTLEPCVMCAGAISQARVGRVIFGAFDPKAGAVASLFDVLRDTRLPHRAEVCGGIRQAECQRLLQQFFLAKRSQLIQVIAVLDLRQ